VSDASTDTSVTSTRLDNAAIAARLTQRFPSLTTDEAFGELTVHASGEVLVELLAFCRDDAALRCELLADLSGVHWPAGGHTIERQPTTTGWPTFRFSEKEGVIEVLYILRSIRHGHRLRIAVSCDDTAARVPTATTVYETADFHEREVYDFFGVDFEGHPDLTRILMPDDWVGHPHRKDYPLGGIDVPYKNDKHIPPPDERSIREVVR
jgi:NADH-quinone oxidoreductase subunit C